MDREAAIREALARKDLSWCAFYAPLPTITLLDAELAAARKREKAVTDLAERWEREAEEADNRAQSENASSLEDQVEDRRSASRARNRAAELRAALADGGGET